MNRVLLGTLAGLLLVAIGMFWWQGRVETEVGTLPLPGLTASGAPATLPSAGASTAPGVAPPQATAISREQRRFDRLDRDRDGRVTRTEMLLPRVPAFRKLDANGDNLLSFDEWSGRTSDKFKAADANRDNWLSRPEYATTAPKLKPKPVCRCAVKRSARKKGDATLSPPPNDVDDDGADDGGSAQDGSDPSIG